MPPFPAGTRPRMAALLALASALALAGCLPHQARRTASPLDGARQLVLVTSASWEATQGELRRFERDRRQRWREVGEAVPVTLGRSGSAWGLGLHGAAAGAGPAKREGDGRAPAGAFRIGTCLDGEADDGVGAEQLACDRGIHVVSAQMHAVGACSERHIDAVVDHKRHAGAFEGSLDAYRHVDHLPGGGGLVAVLDQRRAVSDGDRGEVHEIAAIGKTGIDDRVQSVVKFHGRSFRAG